MHQLKQTKKGAIYVNEMLTSSALIEL